MTKAALSQPKLLTFEELKGYGVLLGRRQVDRLEAAGKFPQRVAISEWRVGWVTDEIVAWVKTRIDARTTRLSARRQHRSAPQA